MMHNAIVHHPLMYVQPVPEQEAATPRPTALILLFRTFSMLPYGLRDPFGQLRSADPAVSSVSILCTPGLFAGGAVGEAGKSLDQCQPCSDTAKTSVLLALFSS